MILDQLEEKKGFTSTESELADYILANLLEVTDSSIAELAKKTYTSKATIIRFCKKLGLFGYIELQKRLSQEMIETKRLAEILDEEPVNGETSVKEVSTIVPAIYEQAVTNTRLSLNMNQINRILNRFKHVSKLEIYGTGITSSIAKSAAFKFATLGIEAEALEGINEHYLVATKHKKNRIALVISFTGKNKQMIAAAKQLRKAGIFVVGIGDGENGTLSKYCDEYLVIYKKRLILSMEVITAITAANYAIDVLFVANLVSNYAENRDNSLEVIREKMLNELTLDT